MEVSSGVRPVGIGMVRAYVLRTCLALICLGAATGTSQAATFARPEKSQLCTLQMEGPVRTADVDGFKAALDTLPPRTQVNLCLNSPGGSFFEALRVVEAIAKSERPIRTIVDRGAECYSACALIFMSGRDAQGDRDRKLHIRGKLGFHAPYIKPSADAAYDAETMAQAYRESLRALARFLEINGSGAFPEPLFVQFLLKRPNEFLSVEQIQEAGRWQIDLFGYRKPTQLTEPMLIRACKNDTEWTIEMQNEVTARSTRPIQFKNRRFRIVLAGFGDEAVWSCAVDVYSDPARGLFLDFLLVSDKSEIPKADALETKVKASAGDPLSVPGKPLWYTFDPEMTLKAMPEQ